jgi:hypothetical protein
VTEPDPDATEVAPPADDGDPGDPGDTGDTGDRRAPLWARALGFAVAMALFVGIVAVVLVRDRQRTDASGTTGVTAETFALPADNGGSSTTTTVVPTPSGDGPTTLPRQPRTNDEVALAVERALKEGSGFVYKASCLPQQTVARDDVLECFVAGEPPVKEAPPGTVLAVVIDDQGHFIWTHASSNDDTLDALRAEPNLSCDDLAGQARPWAYVLAYWLANGRPAALDPNGSGRPCEGRYSSADIDQALGGAI